MTQNNEVKQIRNKRTSHQTVNRNILFVIDISGSIGQSVFARVMSVLARYTWTLCGDTTIGMMTFGEFIHLEFCPKCYASADQRIYLRDISDKIRQTKYYGERFRSTAGAIDCLTNCIFPNTACIDRSKPTQIVFFTDGKANRCGSVEAAIDRLRTAFDYIGLEIYAIGIGNIQCSGVTDLLYKNNAHNIFNVNNIDELEALLQLTESNILNGRIACNTYTNITLNH